MTEIAIGPATVVGQPGLYRPAFTTLRRPWIDAARIFAAVAIIWQHNNESPQLVEWSKLSSWAVPFFTVSAIFFVVRSHERAPDRSLRSYIATRFMRIYVPWLAWAVIYFVMRDGKHLLLSGKPSVPFDPWMLMRGTVHHLWFLPFIFFASVATFFFAKAGFPRRQTLPTIVIASLVGIAIGLSPMDFFGKHFFSGRVWNALPSVFWGVALGVVYPTIARSLSDSRLLFWLGAAVFFVCVVIGGTRYVCIFSYNLAGLALLIMALVNYPLDARWAGYLSTLGGLAYGVYLTHILFVEGLQAIAASRGYVELWQLDILTFISSVFGSFALTYLITRERGLRWLVPN